MNSINSNNSIKCMYNEWSSIDVVELCLRTRISVLHKLPQINGPVLVNSCVKPLASLLNSQTTTNINNSNNANNATTSTPFAFNNDYLSNDRDVLWIMEVICYGLSLPLGSSEQHEAVRDCVHVYCEWITALTPLKAKHKSIPFPIRDDPNIYCRKIIEHIYNIFTPRTFTANENNISDVITRQAVLCHRLLRTIECIAHDENNVMDRQTWDTLLIFLLAINDTILSPPIESNDIGTQLCERVVSVLFEIWLICCCRSFPSPSYWKTFQQLCCSWRHRPALIEQWNRINYALTLKLVSYMTPYHNDINPSTPLLNRNILNVILDEMSEETLKQTWYRFLHTIGNPVDLCSPDIISKTDRFYHNACASDNVIDPRQHPCLSNLPHIFYKAMKGVSILVDIFLGIPIAVENIDLDFYKSTTSISTLTAQPPATPPEKRKPSFPLNINKVPSKSSVTTKNIQRFESIQNLLPAISFPSAPEYILPHLRPKSTSILDILADWLFQTALYGYGSESKDQTTYASDTSRSNSVPSFSLNSDLSRKASSTSERSTNETLPVINYECFEAGQAEAIGALCRLFCFKRADEEISLMLNKQSHPSFQKVKQYLTKFHLALQYGLSIKEPIRRQILASILINSAKIFEIDLPGASLLIPHYLKAMEIYLIFREKLNTKAEIEIRRACIKLLLSLLTYPLHFNELPIKDTLSETPSTTFHSLRPRLINLLIQSLAGESDSTNIQMILGGFILLVQDAAAHENACFTDLETNSETIRTNLNSESLRTESPVSLNTQFAHNFNYDPSCESSLTSTDIPLSDDGKGIPDTARGLFGRSLYHISQVLNKCRDKNQFDSHVSLAALEVLSAIARIHLTSAANNSVHSINCFIECKETTKQIFAFIESQCEKPAPFHSKDMHSTIVAAYQCIAVWFHEHPHLLKDRDCITMLLEVIELGISGSKSKKNGHVFKADKQLKPASMRVREAAESLLTLLMNHFGFCPPSPCAPETIVGSCLLDESSLLKFMFLGNNLSLESACDKFKYFVNDNLIMLAILNQPNDKETVCIIRSPFGKYCWSFKFQNIPRKHNFKIPPDYVSRPLPKTDNQFPTNNASLRYLPESLDKIRLTKFDTIVPILSNIITESPEFKTDNEIMLNIIDRVENHLKYEKQKLSRSLLTGKSMECKEPSTCNDFEAARLILSHFSFLTFETLQDAPMGQLIPSLIALNHKNSEFAANLKILDSISNRTSDTIFVYYVKKGQTNPNDILSNARYHCLSNQFNEFVLSLGCVVNVKRHSGWTGHITTSWKANTDDLSAKSEKQGENELNFDGRTHVLYWADVSHELVFIIPCSPIPDEMDNSSLDSEHKPRCDSQADARSISSMSDDSNISNHSKSGAESESTRSSLRRKFKDFLLHNIGCDVKVLVIWMESMDDQFSIPISSLLLTTNTGVETSLSTWRDYLIIYIHPLNNGLFRITIQGSAGRNPTLALPLIDGMVVSKQILGTLVRLTALNVCRRRRLDADSFQPPHVKRRLKVQEIVNKFRLQLPESEFYNSLFNSK